MRYAIITDLHSNIEAFTAVLKKIDQLAPDQIVCLGDLVGYYANPNEVVQIMIERKITCIMGNHDVVACGRVEPDYFNPAAAKAVLWTRDELSDENSAFIRDLPDYRVLENTLRMVHGSVADRDEYLLFRPEIENSFDILKAQSDTPQVAFFGHTHRCIYYEQDGVELYQGRDPVLNLREGAAYLINPGSVGQPRDGDPRAAFCVFDEEKRSVEFLRVNYDIDSTADKVGKLPFGRGLAKRLFQGT